MALKFLTVTLFFALVVFKPVHDAFPDMPQNTTDPSAALYGRDQVTHLDYGEDLDTAKKNNGYMDKVSKDYLWMYLIFAYLFTGLAVYLLITETKRIISVRQEYLGNQSTVTDRTIRLSGIPRELRTEEKIKEFIETLEIGKVDSVMLCRNWKELDDLMDVRAGLLRKLEESWTVYLGRRRTKRDGMNGGQMPDEAGDEENGALLGANRPNDAPAQSAIRPTATIRLGTFGLRTRYVDVIDYYEEKLREIDENIMELRKKTFQPTPLAFVTLDSVAACVSVCWSDVNCLY